MLRGRRSFYCSRATILAVVLVLSVTASAQRGFLYYKDACRVGSPNPTAFAYFKKAYYDHMWTWSRTGSDSAEYYLKRAIEEDPNYAAAYAFLGHVYQFKTYDQRDVPCKLALQKQYAEKAVSFQPRTGDAYSLLSDVKWHERDTLQALSLLRGAIAREPDHMGNYIWLAVRFSQLPQGKDSAVYYLHKLLALDPEFGQAFMKLGNVYLAHRQWDSARFYYQKAIDHYQQVKPRDNRMMAGYCGLGHVQFQAKQYDSALYYYSRYISALVASDFMVKDRELQVAYKGSYSCFSALATAKESRFVPVHNLHFQSGAGEPLAHLAIMNLRSMMAGFAPWSALVSVLPFDMISYGHTLYWVCHKKE